MVNVNVNHRVAIRLIEQRTNGRAAGRLEMLSR